MLASDKAGSLREPLLAQLEESLGPAAFEAARATGRETAPDQLIDELLAVPTGRAT